VTEERGVDRTARVTYRPRVERGALRSFLVVREGRERGARLTPASERAVVGRAPGCQLRLDDAGVSSRHFAVWLAGAEVWIEDLGSSNGTYVDDAGLEAPRIVPVGSTITVGRTRLRHERSTAEELDRERELEADLERAASYVAARLPAPIPAGAVRVAWRYQPSAQIGGDAFVYRWLDADRFAITVLDVSGHGPPAALHAVAVLESVERGAASALADRPGALLAALSTTFPMATSGGLYFTAWHGVFDRRDRRLRFAGAGHPAPLLRAAGGPPEPLVSRQAPIGLSDDVRYAQVERSLPAASVLYLFTDGLFEITSDEGTDWGPAELAAIVARSPVAGLSETQRIELDVRAALPGTRFDDDVSLLVVEID
jgi:sigma-B regulation protein RsbU (phosphoserine phosphatase)